MMTKKTIEVPIELIKKGDIAAMRKLLANSEIFGRWATHEKHGRVFIVSAEPCDEGTVNVAAPEYRSVIKVFFPDLKIEPKDLLTSEDLNNAPVGTIITNRYGALHVKLEPEKWGDSNHYEKNDSYMEMRLPCEVIRWGKGKEQ